MTSSANSSPSSTPSSNQAGSNGPSANTTAEVLYREHQWVPWYWWLGAAFVAALTAATVGLNRHDFWPVITFFIVFALLAWALVSMSKTVITVEKDPDNTRWILVKGAQLPGDVVARSLAVPKTARRSALGPQLDPAAFLVSHQWVDELVMLVLDDPEDPTPYWLVSSKDPEALLRAFVPEQAEQAIKDLNA
ncbi:hypothetical protein AYJ05_05845 [Corynebacterium stationis]|uniref:DUF3093 domain-containing protein n=1 Tax=Corynebacterium stationis TaxID=1705 RepID=A0A177IEX1_9CORY|nr:DUF3093 domain-containing protein [Corynebacterium stationis]OAH27363.1 hypothetical protein AYJ05_05845 [Corynebacterium stationis]